MLIPNIQEIIDTLHLLGHKCDKIIITNKEDLSIHLTIENFDKFNRDEFSKLSNIEYFKIHIPEYVLINEKFEKNINTFIIKPNWYM